MPTNRTKINYLCWLFHLVLSFKNRLFWIPNWFSHACHIANPTCFIFAFGWMVTYIYIVENIHGEAAWYRLNMLKFNLAVAYFAISRLQLPPFAEWLDELHRKWSIIDRFLSISFFIWSIKWTNIVKWQTIFLKNAPQNESKTPWNARDPKSPILLGETI